MIKKNNEKPKFKLNHPEKYMGDPDNIIIRSSWETKVFKFCDMNPNIIKWSSEEISIPYMKPEPDGYRSALYYPDLYVQYKDKEGKIISELIEIKPEKFTKPSKSRKADTKLFENYQYAVNMAKFSAAEHWCGLNGIRFRILSEKSLFS